MISKKIMVMVLTAAVITCSKPVFAKAAINSGAAFSSGSLSATSQSTNTKISEEQAKQIAKDALKKYMDITIDDSTIMDIRSHSYTYNDPVAKSRWDINFNINNGDAHLGGLVSVNGDTGKIINLNLYERSRMDSKVVPIATISKDLAKATAESFISKIAPEEFKATKPAENYNSEFLGNQNFTFSYNRFSDDTPIGGDFITVAIDGVTGKVCSYSIYWTDNLKLPNKDGIIDKQKGTSLFSDNTKMNLAYISTRDAVNAPIEKDTKLVYSNDLDTASMIDAKTGEVLNINKITGMEAKTKDITPAQKEEIYEKSSIIKKVDKPLTENDAETVAKKALASIYNGDFTINSTGHGTFSSGFSGNTISTLSVSFKLKKPNLDSDNGSVEINAATGEVFGIYLYHEGERKDGEKFDPKISPEEAYDKAIQIIAKLYPEKIKDIKTEQTITSTTDKNYISSNAYNLGFSFRRLVNGIPYKYDSITLSFDPKTGELSNLNCSWEPSVSAPASSNTISPDVAKKLYLSKNEPKLMYMLIPKANGSGSMEKEARLVYSINYLNNGPLYVDAFTGKLLNSFGAEIDGSSNSFLNEIKGSSVEKEASALASSNIIDIQDFKLNGNITNLQFVKMLTNIKNFNHYYSDELVNLKLSTTIAKDSPDYKYLQLAVSAGIVDNSGNFDPSALVTREQASMYLVKLLQYDKVGKLKDAFNFQPADKASISPGYVGYVSLAKILGLIDADSNNNIRPKDNITMQEVVKAVYNTLQ